MIDFSDNGGPQHSTSHKRMPYGFSAMAPLVEASFRSTNPRRVIDIGIGYGLLGAMLRNYFCGRDDGKLRKPFPWELVGIEGWAGYANPMWDLYDWVKITKIEDVNWGNLITPHDLVVCIDVLEHLPRDVGMAIVQATTRGIFGVCTVMYDRPVAPFGNAMEDHITQWAPEDFAGIPGARVERLNDAYFALKIGI